MTHSDKKIKFLCHKVLLEYSFAMHICICLQLLVATAAQSIYDRMGP